MTLYLPDFESTNKLAVNGDLSGYTTYYLALYSRYTNKTIGTTSYTNYEWAPELILDTYNSRYTEFLVSQFAFNISALNTSGIYDYTIWASEFDLNPSNDPFDPEQWTILQDGLLKLYSQRTDNMSDDNVTRTIKHTTDPNTAESYVIYNP